MLAAERRNLCPQRIRAPETIIVTNDNQIGITIGNMTNQASVFRALGHDLVKPIIIAAMAGNDDLTHNRPATRRTGFTATHKLIAQAPPIIRRLCRR